MITGTDGLTFSGNPTLRITNAQAPANGTYTLIDYTGAPITQGFTLALPGHTTGQLLYDFTPSKAQLGFLKILERVGRIGRNNRTFLPERA